MHVILHYGEKIIGHHYVKCLISEQLKYKDIFIISIWNNKDIYDVKKIGNYLRIEGVFSFSEIMNFIKIFKVEIIHFHTDMFDKGIRDFVKSSYKLGIKHFYNAHGHYEEYISLIELNIEKYFTGFIVQHKKSKNILEKKLNLSNSNIFFLPISTTKGIHISKNNNKKISFGYIGRVNDLKKGIGILSKVLLKLEKEFGNYDFHFFTFHLTDEDKKIMESIGIFRRKNIHFYYNNDDKNFIFSNIDLLVIPSYRYETGPLVLYEALSCKTPCMVSDKGDMKNLVIHGVNGIIFKQRSVDSLYKYMKNVLLGKYDISEYKENIDYNYFIDVLCIDLFKLYGIIDYGKKI